MKRKDIKPVKINTRFMQGILKRFNAIKYNPEIMIEGKVDEIINAIFKHKLFKDKKSNNKILEMRYSQAFYVYLTGTYMLKNNITWDSMDINIKKKLRKYNVYNKKDFMFILRKYENMLDNMFDYLTECYVVKKLKPLDAIELSRILTLKRETPSSVRSSLKEKNLI